MKRLLAYPFMLLLTTACVTINIYFPAAAAEEAARTIVRDVLQGESPPPEDLPGPSGDRESSLRPAEPAGLQLLGGLLHLLVAPAQAAGADIDINTPAISALRQRMQRRQGDLGPYYRSGAIGFDNAGMVAMRSIGQVPLAQRNALKKLVADENADRARLYQEIANANGHPEWEQQVRETFASVWVQEAPKGYWYQQPSGSWTQR
jgi:uncharacterized protein YdbL (DUF1318 family)